MSHYPRRPRPSPLLEALLVVGVAIGLGPLFTGCGDSQGATGGKPAAAVRETATLEGRISDAANGRALAGASVTLETGLRVLQAGVGFDGMYRFENVPAGRYQLTASIATHQPLLTGLFLTAGVSDRRDLNLVAIQQQGAIDLTVVDGLSRLPLAGVDIRVLATTSRGLTDAVGKLLLTGLPAGTVRLTLDLPGYQRGTAAIQVTPGEVTAPEIGLVRDGGSVQGTVMSFPGGTPLPGALVSVEGLDIATVTDALGRYGLDDVPSGGAIDIAFEEPSHAPLLLTTAVVAGGSSSLDASLFLGFGSIQGVVRRNLGLPLAGAVVSIPEHSLTTVTDIIGRYAFPRVPAEPTVSIGAFAAGHSPTAVLLDVLPGAMITQDLELIAVAGTLTGTVRRAADLIPVPGAQISVPNLFLTTFADAAGLYTLPSLPAQLQLIRVTAVGLSDLATTAFVFAGVINSRDLLMDEIPLPVPLGTIVGKVKSSVGGAGIPFAIVSAPTLARSTFASSAGDYALSGVPEQPALPLIVNAAGFMDVSTNVAVVGGMIQAVDLELDPN